MGDPFHDTTLPRGALLGAAALIGLSLIGATFSRLYGVSATPAPPAAVVEMRELRFDDRADGAVVVTDAGSGAIQSSRPGPTASCAASCAAWPRSANARTRARETPFRLTRWSDGRLSLTDPLTQRNVYLEAFGPTNAAAFAVLLEQPPQDK